MRSSMLMVGAAGALVVSILLGPQTSQAQDLNRQVEGIVEAYLASHPDELGKILTDYLAKHPEAIEPILSSVFKHVTPVTAGTPANSAAGSQPVAEQGALVADNAPLLFSSPHQVTLGNSHGGTTLVEFFDYNCGFCKRALPDMLALLKSDPNLKIVLKEYPILGPGSVDAARVAIAVRMQDPAGQKYLAFHRQLLGDPGPASKDKALAAAKAAGLNMARLKHDMASAEVDATLAENTKLADTLGIHGTPGYVIGNAVVIGAVGESALQAQLDNARNKKVN